jgi:hypothetical protein
LEGGKGIVASSEFVRFDWFFIGWLRVD